MSVAMEIRAYGQRALAAQYDDDGGQHARMLAAITLARSEAFTPELVQAINRADRETLDQLIRALSVQLLGTPP